MRNISVPTNDTMIFAVHGDTVDECIADCAKLMAYLTSGAQPENTVDDDDDYDADDYDDYELDDEDDDDTVDDDGSFFDEMIDNLYFRIRNLNDKDFLTFVFELYANDILDDYCNAKNCLKYRTTIFGYLNDYFDSTGSIESVDSVNRMIDNL